MMATVAAPSANPFSDRYVEPSAQLKQTADTTVFFNIDNDSDSSCNNVTVSATIQQTVLSEPNAHWVPGLNWSPPSSQSSHASWSMEDEASTAPTSPVSKDRTDSMDWDNRKLMYLLSILKPEEVAADALTINPPLEVLEDLTYPFHLQIHKKEISIPPGSKADAYSKDAPIGTGRPQPRILIAESNCGCLSPELARHSFAYSIMADHVLVDATIARYNALWAIHSTEAHKLESMLRGMKDMITVADDEWQEHLDQLRGMVGGDYVGGDCVDGECSLEGRLEYYFLHTGKIALEDWIRCVSKCLSMESDEERAEHAETYGEAGGFLGWAFEDMLGEA